MIIVGIILLVVAACLPSITPVPYGIVHLCDVLGWVFLVVGLILLVLSLVGRPVGGRQYWY